MLALSFTFPAGKYHATPWDRHVNEGAVVWPPEPWRVLRALIATWHHKVKHIGKHDKSTLSDLVETLSQYVPEYSLPTASHAHVRHFMPQKEAGGVVQLDGTGRRIIHIKKGAKWVPNTALVFDAFAAIDRNEPLIMAWQDIELPADQLALLDDLLDVMGYLGRAESWVEARRFDGHFQPNCSPGREALDETTGELNEVISLLAPLPSVEYEALRKRFLLDEKAEKKLGSTLPVRLLDALSVETADLRKQGWSQPPAARKVSYLRPLDALKPKRTTQQAPIPDATTVCYLLLGKPLPRVEDSIRIGELLRSAIMSKAKELLGENVIPSTFSGHGLDPNLRHRHAFYLPWDSNGDGRIDRLVLHLPDGLGLSERKVAEKLRRLWSRDGGEWRLAVECIGATSAGGPLLAVATQWDSVTPYLHPWHVKKKFDVEAQILRECRQRGLPEPIRLDALPAISVGTFSRKTIHFRRLRSRHGLNQPDRIGSFWRLTFATPVTGPLALGFGCHFGLGLFRPALEPSPASDSPQT